MKQNNINWLNTLFLILTPIIGIIGTIALWYYQTIPWQTWMLFFSCLFVCGLGITAGYHRLFAHKTYKASQFVRVMMVLLGSSCFEGSVLEWSSDHRNHHRYVDTDKDPYNIHRGFWYAHIGWLIRLDPNQRDFSNINDLTKSKLLQFQHKYFAYIATLTGFIVPMLIASLWGDPLGGLIVAGVLRVVVSMHSTFFINSLCHYYGKRTYSMKQTARDNWLTALVTNGEGFHNFHHQFALDYRNGIRFFHFDPTKWVIFSLSKLGLVSDLKRVSTTKILSYRLNAEEALIKEKNPHDNNFINQTLSPLKSHIDQLLHKITQLEAELVTLREAKVKDMKAQYQSHKQQLNHLLTTLKSTRKELSLSLHSWRALVQSAS